MEEVAELTCGPEELGVWFSTALSTRLPVHRHPTTELNLLMAGSVAYETEKGNVCARAGEIVVLPAELQHELVHASEDAALWVLELRSCEARSLLDGKRPALLSPEAPASLAPEPGWATRFVACLRKLWLRPPRAQAERLTEELLGLLQTFQTAAVAPDKQLHEAVVRARLLCDAEGATRRSADELARLAGISASRLAHLFQEQLGVSPLQYQNFVRLQHFIRKRANSDPSLLRAALRAGFGSYPQFHRVFQQVCGAPPGAHFRWLMETDLIDSRTTVGAASGG